MKKLVLFLLGCLALPAMAVDLNEHLSFAMTDVYYIYPQGEVHSTEIIISPQPKACEMALEGLIMAMDKATSLPNGPTIRKEKVGCFPELPKELSGVRFDLPLGKAYYVKKTIRIDNIAIQSIGILYQMEGLPSPAGLCEQMAQQFRPRFHDAKCIKPLRQ